MSYLLKETNQDIVSEVLAYNHLTKQDIDVENFVIDDLKIIEEFKEIILSLKEKKFLIVGDYDCDGICATAIIKKLLDDLKIKNNYYIPSRSKEGYGLNNKIVQNALDNQFEVLICVDNGIVAKDSLKMCAEHNLKVLIIDHHEYQEEPLCLAFLHPNLFAKKYADMCAAGLCYLLSNSFREDELSCVLGGLASLADMVSVLNFNRYLLKKMMKILKEKEIYPIKYLLGKNTLSYKSLSFNVIPKINAVSRLEEYLNVNYVVKYLLADELEALKYFEKIETINETRKQLSKKMYEDALLFLNDNKVNIICSEDFKEGLCGLLANRLLNETGKTTLVFSKKDGLLKGSGRANNDLNLYEALLPLKDKFESFGGHNFAIGLALKENYFSELKEYLNNYPYEFKDKQEEVLLIKQEDLNFNTIETLQNLAPYGIDFKEPKFAIKADYERKIIVSNKYPKYLINKDLSAISFNVKHLNLPASYFVGSLKADEYYLGKLSFLIEDLI